jgi:hypothetical protein
VTHSYIILAFPLWGFVGAPVALYGVFANLKKNLCCQSANEAKRLKGFLA